MKKLNKVAMLVAAVALIAPMSSVLAQPATTAPGRIDNWRNVDGNVWKNGTRELCWREGIAETDRFLELVKEIRTVFPSL